MTEKQKIQAIKRKGERLIRLAYQLGHEASEMRSYADLDDCRAVADFARTSGRIGRAMLDSVSND